MDRKELVEDFDVVRNAIEYAILYLSGTSAKNVHQKLSDALFSLTRIEKSCAQNTK